MTIYYDREAECIKAYVGDLHLDPARRHVRLEHWLLDQSGTFEDYTVRLDVEEALEFAADVVAAADLASGLATREGDRIRHPGGRGYGDMLDDDQIREHLAAHEAHAAHLMDQVRFCRAVLALREVERDG